MSTKPPTLRGLIGRGLRKRCPRCGDGKVFEGWFTMRDACPRCGYNFSREEGYWTGAMIVNIAVAEAWFFVLFVTIIVATLPDIAWQPLLITAVVTNTLLPIVFYPYSKTLWMAIDLHFHKPDSR
ncbi:MAG TPA: DUF983 domain-containing protein [Actinomycetota bacterium]|nr:DUF983 domain-containing protein [Actinomycetota bacterium]